MNKQRNTLLIHITAALLCSFSQYTYTLELTTPDFINDGALDHLSATSCEQPLDEIQETLPDVFVETAQEPEEILATDSGAMKTLAIIKPDAFGDSGKIIDLIIQNGFIIRACEMRHLTVQEAEAFYAVHEDKEFFDSLILFMTAGPVMVLVLEHSDATIDTVAAWRALAGATNPDKARLGSIRYMFGTDIQRNAVHGSESAEAAGHEITLLFPYGYGSNRCGTGKTVPPIKEIHATCNNT